VCVVPLISFILVFHNIYSVTFFLDININIKE